MSQVKNTQSCVQDELSQGKRKTTSTVLNNSCTIHTVLNNNNCTGPRCVRQTHTVLAVLTKTTHVWTQLERILETLKHSLKHHESPPENTRTNHVNLRILPRRWVPRALRRFKQSRWAINSCLAVVSPCTVAAFDATCLANLGL